MTDKEIIKTLTKAVFIGDSPIGKGFGTIIDKQTVKETIDFINRQKAEIERLKTAAKSEAIKEFAEKLKSEYDGFDVNHEIIEYQNLLKAIDYVTKEMVGD